MKATVINAFGDSENADKLYMPGDEFEAAEKRIAELEAGGFVKRSDEARSVPRARRTTKE